MKDIATIIIKANSVSIGSYYLFYMFMKLLTGDENKMTVRLFKLDSLLLFFNGYITAILGKGDLVICFLSGLSFAFFQTLISALLNVIIDGANIEGVIRYWFGKGYGSWKFTLLLYILIVLSCTFLGYVSYHVMVVISG